MNTHISKELAQWLKERGCEIESEAYHVSKDGKTFILSTQTKFIYGSAPDLSEAEYPFIYSAYSWYDILVTHAKEFWGEEDYFCAECREQIYDEDGCQNMKCQTENHEIVAHLFYPEYLLELLQNGLVEEAENEVREHSLFANPTTL